jgi:predicted aspartyl protease
MKPGTHGFVAAILMLSIAACEQLVVPQSGSAQPVRPGEVEFELAGPGGAALVVPVRINGQGPFPLVLDTGATLTCLDQQLTEELALEAASGMRGIGGGIGSMGAIDLVHIDTLEVGSAASRDLVACSIDLGSIGDLGIEVRGLLGLNFLKSFLVTIDFQRQTLRLDPAGREDAVEEDD